MSINWSKKKAFQFKSKTHSMFYIPQSTPMLHLNFRAKLSMQKIINVYELAFLFIFCTITFFLLNSLVNLLGGIKTSHF